MAVGLAFLVLLAPVVLSDLAGVGAPVGVRGSSIIALLAILWLEHGVSTVPPTGRQTSLVLNTNPVRILDFALLGAAVSILSSAVIALLAGLLDSIATFGRLSLGKGQS